MMKVGGREMRGVGRGGNEEEVVQRRGDLKRRGEERKGSGDR